MKELGFWEIHNHLLTHENKKPNPDCEFCLNYLIETQKPIRMQRQVLDFIISSLKKAKSKKFYLSNNDMVAAVNEGYDNYIHSEATSVVDSE